MMNIGEFAELTGLSLKALRLYDEQGLLPPASVDPWSRHRRYSAAQFDDALRLKAARAADLPLADAQKLLGGAPEATALLAGHRARLKADRERQDAALEALDALLADRVEWQTEVRQAERQHWVGAVLDQPDEMTDDQANEVFAGLWRRLSAAGNPPTGAFWTTLRAAPDSETEVQVVCCWPVAEPAPADWDVEHGTIEPGPEMVVRWHFDQEVPLVDGATHPAVLALLAAAEERGTSVSLSQVRQIGLLDGGAPVGMEVAVRVDS